MRHITTGDLVDHLILKAKEAEKNRIISSLHPTAANAAATKRADRNLRSSKEALNRHFMEVCKEAGRLSKKKKVDNKSPKRR
jgi:hypothetical protein